jgi:hypothetical protein
VGTAFLLVHVQHDVLSSTSQDHVPIPWHRLFVFSFQRKIGYFCVECSEWNFTRWYVVLGGAIGVSGLPSQKIREWRVNETTDYVSRLG